MVFQTVRGMRDLIGKDAEIQEFIEGNFKRVFLRYGYLPLYTSAVENFSLFNVKGSGGEEIKKEIYYFKDKSDRELGLRVDLTMPTARVVATSQLKMPFKRYQIGDCYRYDRPQAKRYRAFTQADIDIFGIKGLEAELEIMLIVRDCFDAVKLKPNVIFNSRKLLDDLLKKYAPGKEIEAMRILDKLDKIGADNVKEMLKEKDIDEKVVEIIERNDLGEITQIVGQDSSGLKEVKDFLDLCKENGLAFVGFDASLARGLEYYTGIVFEAKISDGPSIAGGGRYDKLVETYGGKETAATGISFGVSRIYDYLQENGFKLGMEGLFLTGIGINAKELVKIGNSLRSDELFIETDLQVKSISKAFDFAEKKGYTFVGIIGENEKKAGTITIKNLKTGKQETIEMNAEKIKGFLVK
jgi:histidyl-tRNA synthetase